MLLLEHRYYGQSRPTPDLGVKSLGWLSSRQALADLAAFTVEMQARHNLTGPWIALGGSYPGSLAAWYRLKVRIHQHCSSSPLLCFALSEVVDVFSLVPAPCGWGRLDLSSPPRQGGFL